MLQCGSQAGSLKEDGASGREQTLPAWAIGPELPLAALTGGRSPSQTMVLVQVPHLLPALYFSHRLSGQ
jgi:hypothetical protein